MLFMNHLFQIVLSIQDLKYKTANLGSKMLTMWIGMKTCSCRAIGITWRVDILVLCSLTYIEQRGVIQVECYTALLSS